MLGAILWLFLAIFATFNGFSLLLFSKAGKFSNILKKNFLSIFFYFSLNSDIMEKNLLLLGYFTNGYFGYISREIWLLVQILILATLVFLLFLTLNMIQLNQRFFNYI
jgi:hypothetical protein